MFCKRGRLVIAWCMVAMWVTVLLFSTAPALAAPSQASTIHSSNTRQALLVLIDRLGYEDLQQMPHVQQLVAEGAVGVMNTNTGGKRTDANACATLAIGAPAQVSGSALLAYDAQERVADVPAAQLYQQLHGTQQGQSNLQLQSNLQPLQQPGLLVLSMPRLLRDQDKQQFAGTFGAIGDVLHRAGLQTAAFGGEDTGADEWRPAALLTTDLQGRIDAGDVGPRLLAAAPERPYGVRTNYSAMWQAFTRVQNHVSWAVFDLGDLYRLDAYKSHLEPERYQKLRNTILQEIDQFAAHLVTVANPNRLVMLAAPQVSHADREQSNWLAPIVLAGGDVAPKTLVTSATTRRDGIVANVDIAPTVLHFLGIAPLAQMIGYPLTSTHSSDAKKLGDLLQQTVWTYTHRTMVLTLVGVWIGIGWLATLLRLIFALNLPQRPLRMMLWTGLSLPLCLFVLPTFRAQGLWETAGSLIITLLLFVAIPFRILSFCHTLTGRTLWLTTATLIAVLADTWRGGLYAQSSIMSYDPILGTRYYGVGNEYMGVVVGCAILCYSALLYAIREHQRFVKWGGVVGGVLLTLFFASPNFGTNTGGALTMAGTTTLCWVTQQPIKRHRWLKSVFAVVCAMIGAALLLVWLNSADTTPSHIGAATHQVLTGGTAEFARILARKSGMFWRILSTSFWPTVLLLILAGFAAFLSMPLSRKASWRASYASYWQGVTTITGGAVIGLLTNDTGISVAAMMLLFAMFPSLLIWLEVERETAQDLQQVQVFEPPLDGERTLT